MQDSEPWTPPRSYRPSPAAITALVAAVIGFVCSFSSTTRISIDGQRSCTFFDLAPLTFAVIGGSAGLVALVKARRPPRQPLMEIGLGLPGVGVAAIHVLRAFGILDSGC